MKWIRAKGLILFVLAAGGLAVLFLFFIDGMIERGIEKTGTAIMDARVDLASADLSLFPLGIRLDKLEVTDPDDPMTNAVEVETIAFTMDTGNLFRRKLIVDEMALDGMRFKTPRKRSGAIAKKSDKAPEAGKPAEPAGAGVLPSLDFPSPKELLEQETLNSLTLIESTRNEIKTGREDWKRRLDELPDKKTWEGYREKIKAVKAGKKGGLGGLLGSAGEAAALQKDITGDLDKLKEARTTLKQDVASLKEKTTLAARAPLEDVQRLKDKYSLSPEGLSNLSRGLFGKQIGDWARTALHWYGRVAPYLDKAGAASEEEKAARPERGTGVDIHFTEKNPMPGFWVRTARLSADFPFGNLSGALKDVSSDQPVLGKPASFDLAGEELKSIQSVTLSGVFNHVIPDAPRDDFTLNLSGLALKDKTISGSTLLPAKIKEGTVGMNGKAAFKGEAFTARFDTGLKEVSFETPLSDDAPLAQRTMASALSNITAFQVGTDITGTPEDYSIGISSDLDRVLKEAVGKEIQKEAARFEERLKKAVTEKTEAEISRLESELAGMNGISEEITSRLNLGDDLLKELAQKGLGGIKLPFGK